MAHYSVRRYSEIKDVYALSEMEMLLRFKRNRMTRGHGGRVENRTDRPPPTHSTASFVDSRVAPVLRPEPCRGRRGLELGSYKDVKGT